MPAALVGTRGEVIGQRFELVPAETRIGRVVDGNDLAFPECLVVSRHHARIRRDGDQYVLEDLRSASGCYVNDHLVRMPTPLRHGDRVLIGGLGFQFEIA